MRYERYTLIGPGLIKVGEDARLQADVDLDDGSRLTGFYFSTTSSSNPSVLFVDPARETATVTATVIVSPGLDPMDTKQLLSFGNHSVTLWKS